MGIVPTDAQSIQFRTSLYGGESPNFILSLNGTPLVLQALDGTHTLYGGDIGSFRGQLADLRITTTSTPDNLEFGSWVDSISFSPVPVPEPSILALLAISGLVCGARWWRKSARN